MKIRQVKIVCLLTAALALLALAPAFAAGKAAKPQAKAAGTNLQYRVVLVYDNDNESQVVWMQNNGRPGSRPHTISPQQPFAVFFVPVGNVAAFGWAFGKTSDWGSSQFPPPYYYYLLGSQITPGFSVIFTSQFLAPWLTINGF